MESNIEDNLKATNEPNEEVTSTDNTTYASNAQLPKNYFIPSIIATIFCCPPIGIFAIIHATRVERLFIKGEYEAAEQASKKAKQWIQLSILAWSVCVAIYFIVVYLFSVDIPY